MGQVFWCKIMKDSIEHCRFGFIDYLVSIPRTVYTGIIEKVFTVQLLSLFLIERFCFLTWLKIWTLSSIFAGNNNASGTMIDDKSKQWFGATVHSSGKDGIIVVCMILSFSSGFWDLELGSLGFRIGITGISKMEMELKPRIFWFWDYLVSYNRIWGFWDFEISKSQYLTLSIAFAQLSFKPHCTIKSAES